MKRWGEYHINVRASALAFLHTQGIHCWQPDFDENSDYVLSVCHAIAWGKPIPDRQTGMKITFVLGDFPEIDAEFQLRRDVMR